MVVELNSNLNIAFEQRVIQDFMDLIVLKQLSKCPNSSGYDIIKHLHQEFRMLPSPGTVYSLLHSLERKGLIKGKTGYRKTQYTLSIAGEEFVKELRTLKPRVQVLLSSIMTCSTKDQTDLQRSTTQADPPSA